VHGPFGQGVQGGGALGAEPPAVGAALGVGDGVGQPGDGLAVGVAVGEVQLGGAARLELAVAFDEGGCLGCGRPRATARG